jgi:hypothetical protein
VVAHSGGNPLAHERDRSLTLGSDPARGKGAHGLANMVKKSKIDADAEPASNGDAQRSTDLVIAPEKTTPKLETSKWPLLLKVSITPQNGCKQLRQAIAALKNAGSMSGRFRVQLVHVYVRYGGRVNPQQDHALQSPDDPSLLLHSAANVAFRGLSCGRGVGDSSGGLLIMLLRHVSCEIAVAPACSTTTSSTCGRGTTRPFPRATRRCGGR